MTDKPAAPANPFDPWPRIPVDTADGSVFAQILRIASFAADDWALGPDGPYKREMTPAHRSRCEIREALLHLLELGLIDIDADRLTASEWLPLSREQVQP